MSLSLAQKQIGMVKQARPSTTMSGLLFLPPEELSMVKAQKKYQTGPWATESFVSFFHGEILTIHPFTQQVLSNC